MKIYEQQFRKSVSQLISKTIQLSAQFDLNLQDKNLMLTTTIPPRLKFSTIVSRRTFHAKYFAFCKTDALKLLHIGFDSSNRIFINENLSKTDLDLLKRAKHLKKIGKISRAYSYDGKVCVYHI